MKREEEEEKAKTGVIPMGNGGLYSTVFIRPSTLCQSHLGRSGLSVTQNMSTPRDWEEHGNRRLWVTSRDAHQLSVNAAR